MEHQFEPHVLSVLTSASGELRLFWLWAWPALRFFNLNFIYYSRFMEHLKLIVAYRLFNNVLNGFLHFCISE